MTIQLSAKSAKAPSFCTSGIQQIKSRGRDLTSNGLQGKLFPVFPKPVKEPKLCYLAA